MILLTGAAGFIGSNVAAALNAAGRDDLLLCDDFGRPEKSANHAQRRCLRRLERDALWEWLDDEGEALRCCIHMGARTDTAERDESVFEALNLGYSQRLWRFCAEAGIPFVYASSAATYGDGSLGFSDDPALIPQLRPLNPYGWSKQRFDCWALEQAAAPPRWAGLKFFNVYGPNEQHKGRMASVVFHAFHQIRRSGRLRLFRSHRPDIADGQQLRDFVHVDDIVRQVLYFALGEAPSGIYNAGSGQARSFEALGRAVFEALGLPTQIEYIDIPPDIRDSYQYFTEADLGRLRAAGYAAAPASLEEGVQDYVQHYLLPERTR